MKNLISMIVMTLIWRRKTVTLFQGGKIFAIGKVKHISDHWMVLADVRMAGGKQVALLAVSCRKIDRFWKTEAQDEAVLEEPLPNGKASEGGSVDSDEGDD